MSPASSCFSFETSSTTSPFRTVALLHLGSWRVEDTTYLGRLFNLSAHAPLLDSHRVANHSSLRRASSRASARSASSSETLAHSSRSLPPNSPNQPPSLKPSLPSGSWTTPSNETFVLITIFPIVASPSGCHARSSRISADARIIRAVNDAGAAAPGNWPPAGRPVHPLAGAYTNGRAARCGKKEVTR